MSDLQRVSAAIGPTILTFLAERLEHHRGLFHAEQLRSYVAERCGPTSPASADRVLRSLRQDGKCAYEVVQRAASLYRVLGSTPARPQ
jgi:hypothetical protein